MEFRYDIFWMYGLRKTISYGTVPNFLQVISNVADRVEALFMLTMIVSLNLTMAALPCTYKRYFMQQFHLHVIKMHCVSSNRNSEAGLNTTIL